ncbi:hypothetical protein AGLY_005868 [Aphis glycines]|uniref:BESS domain-containing protein n=1 Tax=Aphis glycines TaxID=307491 RepID=A0A6G0TUF6_APHGL|nr:hypothetical protein AGLY_005868 [Aphis glycines]
MINKRLAIYNDVPTYKQLPSTPYDDILRKTCEEYPSLDSTNKSIHTHIIWKIKYLVSASSRCVLNILNQDFACLIIFLLMSATLQSISLSLTEEANTSISNITLSSAKQLLCLAAVLPDHRRSQHVNRKRTQPSSLDETVPEDIEDNLVSPNMTEDSSDPKVLSNKKNRRCKRKLDDELDREILKAYQEDKTPPSLDEDESFFASVIPLIKKFSEDEKLKFPYLIKLSADVKSTSNSDTDIGNR